jgi:hypothetical protein
MAIGDAIFGRFKFCEFCDTETWFETNFCEDCWQEYGTA